MSGKPMQDSSSYMRFAGMVPETILQNRQSEDEGRGGSEFIFIVKSTSDAVLLPRGCRLRRTRHGRRSWDGWTSRDPRRDGAWDRPARFLQASERPAPS